MKGRFSPVWDGYLADPYVWQHNGIYYAIGTGGAEADGGAEIGERVVPLLRSNDLKHWEFVHHALVHPGLHLGGQIWAPAVAFDGDAFYMYYSVGQCGTGVCNAEIPHHLRVARSQTPEGPYEDCGKPLLLPGDEIFVFDAHPFQDDDGRWYLFYNRNYRDVGPEGRAGDAIAARPLETMMRLGQNAAPIMRPAHDWQRGPERMVDGVPIDWHTCEGACVVERQGKYYCFFSGSAWFTEQYGVDYAIADSVLGPYTYEPPVNAPRVLKAADSGLRGPGHNSLVTGPDGKTDWIIFHAWDGAGTKRQMYAEPLVWTEDGPRLAF